MNLAPLGPLFLLTLYLQRERGRSAISAGVAVLQLFVPLAIFAPLAGRLTGPRRRPPAKWPAIGLPVAAVGVALLGFTSTDSTT